MTDRDPVRIDPDAALRGVDEAVLAQRRSAVTELGNASRLFVDAVVRNEAPVETLEDVTGQIAELSARLLRYERPLVELASVDDYPNFVRMFNPAAGTGNPISPPMHYDATEPGENCTRMTARCRLGRAHEGPHTYGHGGISGVLLDQISGRVAGEAGLQAVTVELSLSYHRPVPLDTSLIVWGQIRAQDDREVLVDGGITTTAAPDRVLVSSSARFRRLRKDQVRRMFTSDIGV